MICDRAYKAVRSNPQSACKVTAVASMRLA